MKTFDIHQTQRPTTACLPQSTAVVRDGDWVGPVAEQIAEPLHVGQVVLETSALQMGPFGPTSGSSGLLAGAPLPEVCMKSCIWPLQGKLAESCRDLAATRGRSLGLPTPEGV